MASFFQMVLLISIFSILVLNSECQTPVVKTAVEGVSRNLAIVCDLSTFQYWKINELIYDKYNVPQIFTVEYEGIVISNVDRRMDGWRFQCFTVDPNSSDGLRSGSVFILAIIYDMNIEEPDNSSVPLLPSIHAITLFYGNSRFGPNTTTLSWLYPVSNSLCVATKYDVSIYRASDIDDATSESSLMSISNYTSTEENIELPSSSLHDNNTGNYFNISASYVDSICTTSKYFYSTLPSEINEDIYVNQNSASFVIPEKLRNNRSLQLIWSTDEDTQCVCPPVEQFMSTCACNTYATNNKVTITNNRLVVSNLTQNMTFYFVSSVSSGCHGNCNLQSMAGVYNIFLIQEAPSTSAESNYFCFSNNGAFSHGVVYEVNLTDSTGSLTPLSGIHSTPKCLSISPSLYPDVCGPFQLSVVAISQVARSAVKHQTVLADNELNPCYCYEEKKNIEVDIVTVNSTSALVTLSCYTGGNVLTLAIVIINAENLMVYDNVTVPCNSKRNLTSLMPSADYIINITTINLSCSIQQFRTKDELPSRDLDSTIIGLSLPLIIIIFSIFLILAVILYYVLVKKNCSGGYFVKNKEKEEKKGKA